jgi:hypothetical protein
MAEVTESIDTLKTGDQYRRMSSGAALLLGLKNGDDYDGGKVKVVDGVGCRSLAEVSGTPAAGTPDPDPEPGIPEARLREMAAERQRQRRRRLVADQLVDELLDAVRELTMLLARMRKAGKACNCPACVPLAIISLEIDAAIGPAGREVTGS